MANTIDFILTNAASELIAQVLAGKTLNFTRMAVGDGFSYDTTAAKDYTALVNEVLSIDITKSETLSASSVKVTSAFKNTDAQKEFYYREVGLYAQDLDTGEEILYAYGNRNDAAELITPTGSSVVTKQLVFIISVGDSANVTFNVNADVYALQEDMLSVQANKADRNLANTGMITNCLLEVPQRIKAEIVNGTFILKAGSIVIVPNGNGVFEELIISTDQTATFYGTNGKVFIFATLDGKCNCRQFTECSSGTSDPKTAATAYYNTNSNIVNFYYAAGTQVQASLPIAICTVTENKISSIDQIFNGIGFIGSTVWVDKGVKGLIPNGRNEKGTLNNIIEEVNSIRFSTRVVDGTYPIIIGPDIGLNIGYMSYVESEEKPMGNWMIWYKSSNNTVYIAYDEVGNFQKTYCLCGGTVSIESGNIVSLNPKLPFKVIDHNDYIDRIEKLESRISALEAN